jgi:hypothetical protein
VPLQEGKRAATTAERWQQVHELRAQNVGLLECARRLNLSLNTVKRYDRASEPQRLQRVPKYRPTLVDPYRDHLRKRRAEEPGVPVQQLLREIRELGYQGSSNLLARYINQGRAEGDRPHLSPRRAARILLQLAGITQKLSELDQRQADDARELKERITAVVGLAGQLKDTTASHAQTLAALDGLDRQVADLAAKAATDGPADGGGTADGYRPSAAPKFWKLDGPAHDQAISKLRAWGRAGLPARLRPPGRQPGRLLGPAPAVPVRPGLAVGAVVGAVPGPRPHRGDAGRAGRMAHPAPNSCGGAAHPRNPRLRPRHRPPPRRRHGSAAVSPRTVEQALAYAAHGWPVFPCRPGGKEPATRHGYQDATTDPDKITWWWRRQPEANLAIATGHPGPDVLDVDQHGRAGNGFAAFNRLKRAGLIDGASALVATPSGGLHAYFAGSDQRCGKLPRHHLDFRAHGG